MRSALTLSPDRGGIFDVLLGLVRHGLGGTQGPGTQFVSWIHEADFARAVDLLIAREEFTGVVNIASPNPLPNADFLQALRHAWGTRIGLAAPPWLIEIGTWLMRTESELVLKSRRVVPGRLAPIRPVAELHPIASGSRMDRRISFVFASTVNLQKFTTPIATSSLETRH